MATKANENNRRKVRRIQEWGNENQTTGLFGAELGRRCFLLELFFVGRPKGHWWIGDDGTLFHSFYSFQVCARAIWLNGGRSIHYYSLPPIYPTYPLSPQLLPLTHTLSLFFPFFLSHAHPLRHSSYLIHERDSYGHIRTTHMSIASHSTLFVDGHYCQVSVQSFLFLSCSFPDW